jgi:hypothetical protein
MLGRHDDAVSQFEYQLQLARAIKDRHLEGNALGNLGAARAVAGRGDIAVPILLEGLRVLQEVGDQTGQKKILDALSLLDGLEHGAT